jgi:abortive infection bacteriophage resistance protein
MHTGRPFLISKTNVMAKKEYLKKPLTYQDQVQTWVYRGLQVPDQLRAQSYLSHISYYRLSAYCIPFRSVKDKFNKNITFDDVLSLYMFDRELRLLILDAIERIEIGLRTQIIYQLAHKYGSHWHDNNGLFVSPYVNKYGFTVDRFRNFQDFLHKEYTSTDPEVFIKHYFDNYDTPATPPSWMALELVTIGGLSRLFSNLVNDEDKKIISDNYKLPFFVFESWFHAITHLRNLCAHHCRVWNREYRITPKLLLKPKYNWVDKSFDINNRTFFYLNVLKYFLNSINPNNTFKTKLENLFGKYPNVDIEYLGIPTDANSNLIDWKSQPLWKK